MRCRIYLFWGCCPSLLSSIASLPLVSGLPVFISALYFGVVIVFGNYTLSSRIGVELEDNEQRVCLHALIALIGGTSVRNQLMEVALWKYRLGYLPCWL